MNESRTTVLVATRPDDLTADLVILELNAVGVPVARIDPVQAAASFATRLAGGMTGSISGLELSAIRAVYWRRPSPYQLSTPDPCLEAWSRREYDHGARAALWDLPVTWVNHPAKNAAASKAAQLERAGGLGLSVPDTLITNDPAVAREFVSRFPCITKTFTGPPTPAGGVGYSVLTRPVRQEDIDHAVMLTSHLFQQRIHAVRDVRLTMVDGQVFAAVADTTRLDWRADSDVPWKSLDEDDIPGSVVDGARVMAAGFGLRYAAFDFAIDGDGRWWFYELNPNGQFGFIQQATGLPIAQAVARALSGPWRPQRYVFEG